MGNMEVMDVIYKELAKKDVNWNMIKEQVASLGNEINKRLDEENTILSEILSYIGYKKGDKAVELTKIFLSNGFDVTANGGFNGVSCLHALCWSFYDYRILHIAEMLLDAGTDCNKKFDFGDGEEELVLDSIEWKSGEWMTGAFESGNLFEAYYLMIKRAMEGKSYRGIRTFDDAKGLNVSKIEKILPIDPENKYDIGKGLILWCDNTPVVVNDCIEVMINPYVLEDVNSIDVSNEYKDLIGLSIKSLLYKSQSCARLYFKDNKYLLFDNSYLYGKNKNSNARCIEKKTIDKPIWHVGDIVNAIKFDSGFSLAPHPVELSHWELYLESEDELFHVTGINTTYENTGELCLDAMPYTWGKDLSRSLDIGRLVVSDVCYEERKLKWLCLSSEDKYVYIIPDHFGGIKCFITSERLENPYINAGNGNVICMPIKFCEERSIRKLRFLTSKHTFWNCIEIWIDQDEIRYKLEWRDDLNKRKANLPGPYVKSPTVGISKMTKLELKQRLEEMKFDSWFREDNMKKSKYNEVEWWLFYDDGTGVEKWRDHLDKPIISQKQMDNFIELLELLVK